MAKAPSTCGICGQERTRETPISKRGLCPKCASERFLKNNTALIKKTGPEYEKWRTALARAAGVDVPG